MPIPQLPEALAQKALDGCVVPWEIVPALKLQELVKFHTEMPASPALCASTFVLAMNKAKYASLPPDLRRVLDQNAGQVFAAMAGRMWDEQAALAAAMAKTAATPSPRSRSRKPRAGARQPRP
jgi:TRAP-type C4-dicarboxylate transport system substrate-binding protein